MSKLHWYKKGQGKYTRSITFISVVVLAMLGAAALSNQLRAVFTSAYLQFGIPTAMVLVVGVFMFWMVNRPRTADFLIATEGEMKKVSWSSRKEVVGSTKVVIVTTFMLAAILFAVDMAFTILFKSLGITGT